MGGGHGHGRQGSRLRDDEQVAVSIEEGAILHRRIEGVEMDRHARLRLGRSRARHRHQTIHEIGRLGRRRQRQLAPAVRVGMGLRLAGPRAEVRDEPTRLTARRRRVPALRDRRCDPIHPCALVGGARARESGPRDLLGVEAVRDELRRVLRRRERRRLRLRAEVPAEPAVVLERAPGRVVHR